MLFRSFLIGDVDISDPNGSGAPLLFPDLTPWQRIRVATGLIGSDVNSTGLAISLDPRTAGTRWQHTAYLSTSHGDLASRASSLPQPTIARLGGRDRLAWTGSGPLSASLNGAFSATWTKTTQFDRAAPTAVDASIGSIVGSLVKTLASGATLDTTGWLQNGRTPLMSREVFGLTDATTGNTSGQIGRAHV